MTLKTNDTITHVISTSVKRRQGTHYSHGAGKELDRTPANWWQVVKLTPFGKTVKGKSAYVSQTVHEKVY